MKQIFIGITGQFAAGKTTFAKKLASDLNINHIRSDAIRDFLISEITYYNKAQYSHKNKLIESANKVVYKHRDVLVKELIEKSQSLILDSVGATRKKRAQNIQLVKKVKTKIVTIIIFIETDESTILKRLKTRDAKTGWKWESYYQTTRKNIFEAPSQNEANFIFALTQNNYAKIVKKIKSIRK